MALPPTLKVTFLIRRDTASNWAFVNPILKIAEPAFETDTYKVKFGDGTTPWVDLPYISMAARTDTAANWASNNPILLLGEPGFEIDENRIKYGNGTDAWNDLPYLTRMPVAGTTGQILKKVTDDDFDVAWADLTAGTVEFTPVGGISATDVQGAIAELDAEKVKGPGSSTDQALVRWNGTGGFEVLNSGVVIDGSDNITGASTITVDDDAYGAGWNGSLQVPTKNALYDKIESMISGGGAGSFSSINVSGFSTLTGGFSSGGFSSVTGGLTVASGISISSGALTVAGSGSFGSSVSASDFTTSSFSNFAGGFTAGLSSFSGQIFPTSDNAISCGNGSNRWSVIYAGTGTINTSDERHKKFRPGTLTPQELKAARRIMAELNFFQWLQSVKEKKGDARWHFGASAQRVMTILMEEGLEDTYSLSLDQNLYVAEADRPNFRTAFLCFDTWEDQYQEVPVAPKITTLKRPKKGQHPVKVEERPPERRLTRGQGNMFGLRVDQLALFLLAAQEQRLQALEAKLLEGE